MSGRCFRLCLAESKHAINLERTTFPVDRNTCRDVRAYIMYAYVCIHLTNVVTLRTYCRSAREGKACRMKARRKCHKRRNTTGRETHTFRRTCPAVLCTDRAPKTWALDAVVCDSCTSTQISMGTASVSLGPLHDEAYGDAVLT